MQRRNNSIGIDLGNNYSCVSVFRNDRVEIIPNDQGNRTTPSVVAFTENRVLVGEEAANQRTRNPLNTVYDMKRLLGRKLSDPLIQKFIKTWPFRLEADQQGRVLIVVNYKFQTRKLYPEEIISILLIKLKETAQIFLGESVRNVVISIPSHFNYLQRESTKIAANNAGFNVLRLIDEPSAAALAYSLDNKLFEKNVVLFDLGGSSLNVSVMNLDEGVIEVKAMASNRSLGGEIFDNKLVEYCVADFLKRHKVDLSKNIRAIRRLRSQCERIKRILSSSAQASIEIDSLSDSQDYQVVITRTAFEEMCLPLFKEALESIEKALKDSGISKPQIQEIIFVGGSTRIPKIRELVQSFFNGKEPKLSINLDEAVASGTALQAAILSGQTNQFIDSLMVISATHFSLGLQTTGGVMSVVLPRNSSIPTRKSYVIKTSIDNEQNIQIKIFQGERNLTKDNLLIGNYTVQAIPPAPKGKQITVYFSIDQNSILSITTSDNHKIRQSYYGQFSVNDIQRMKKSIKLFEAQKNLFIETQKAKYSLESYLFHIRNLFTQKLKDKFSPTDKAKVNDQFTRVQNWMQANPNAQISEYKRQKEQVTIIITPMLNNIGYHDQPK